MSRTVWRKIEARLKPPQRGDFAKLQRYPRAALAYYIACSSGAMFPIQFSVLDSLTGLLTVDRTQRTAAEYQKLLTRGRSLRWVLPAGDGIGAGFMFNQAFARNRKAVGLYVRLVKAGRLLKRALKAKST